MRSKDRLNIISQNFNGYIGKKTKEERLEINEKNKKTVTNYLKKYDVDIIAGQELPAHINEEKFMKSNNLDGSFDGQAEGKSDFFTGFYMSNKNYVGELISDKKISEIWDELFEYCPSVPSFRSGFWCEKWIEFCGKRIRIINIHVSLRHDIAIRFSFLKYISPINNEYTIILGDFNAAKNEQTEEHIQANDIFLKKIEGKNYYELISEEESKTRKGHYTFYTSKKGRKLDHIFVSKVFYKKFNYEIEYIDEVSNTHPDYESSESAFTDHSGIKVSFWEK